MASVGVPCVDRLENASGRNPRSDIPSSWYESVVISASNWPSCETAAATTIDQAKTGPPTRRATVAKKPSFHASPSSPPGAPATPIPTKRGSK